MKWTNLDGHCREAKLCKFGRVVGFYVVREHVSAAASDAEQQNLRLWVPLTSGSATGASVL